MPTSLVGELVTRVSDGMVYSVDSVDELMDLVTLKPVGRHYEGSTTLRMSDFREKFSVNSEPGVETVAGYDNRKEHGDRVIEHAIRNSAWAGIHASFVEMMERRRKAYGDGEEV